MATHPYKQQLRVCINSKQDGDLTNTKGKKKNTKTRVDNQIYVETPCRKKNHGRRCGKSLWDETIQEVGDNKDVEAPNFPTDFTFY